MCRGAQVKSALWLLLAAAFLGSTAQGQRLHLIVAADTLDDKIGEGCEVVASTIADLFAGHTQRGRLVVRRVWGRDFTSAAILKTLRELDASPNDSIVFVANCHGSHDESRRHHLHTRTGRLSRIEIVRTCVEKNVRFSAVITDSCNKFYPGRWEPCVAEATPPAATSPLIQSLFFESHGLLDANSSSPGQYSFCSTASGGHFLTSFARVAVGKSNQRLLWRGFLREVEAEVATFFPIEYEGTTYAKQDASVWTVPGSPGNKLPERLSLEAGDIILTINGAPIGGAQACIASVKASPDTMLFSVIDKNDETVWRMSSSLRRWPGARFGIQPVDLEGSYISLGAGVAEVTGRNVPATRNRMLGRFPTK